MRRFSLKKIWLDQYSWIARSLLIYQINDWIVYLRLFIVSRNRCDVLINVATQYLLALFMWFFIFCLLAKYLAMTNHLHFWGHFFVITNYFWFLSQWFCHDKLFWGFEPIFGYWRGRSRRIFWACFFLIWVYFLASEIYTKRCGHFFQSFICKTSRPVAALCCCLLKALKGFTILASKCPSSKHPFSKTAVFA